MFGSSLPSVVCRRVHVLLMLFVLVCVYSSVQHVLTIWVTWRCLLRDRNCLPFASIWVHTGFGAVRVAHLFNFLWCGVLCCFCFVDLSPVPCVTNDSVSELSIIDCSFSWSACVKQEVIYICFRGIHFASFYDFLIGFCSCVNSVIALVFNFIIISN